MFFILEPQILERGHFQTFQATWNDGVGCGDDEGRTPRAATGTECSRGSLGRGKLHEHVGDVLPFGDEKVVWNLGWDVNQVTWRERMPLPALDSRAYVLAGARTSLGVDHFAAQDQRALPALHDDDINHVVMLLWKSIRVPIKHSEAVIAVVGQRFPRGVIRTDLLG